MLHPSLAPAAKPQHIALEHIREGRLEEAISLLRREADEDPKNSGSQIDLGAALKLSGRWEEAREALQRAVSLAPESAVALYNLGSLELESGDLPAALATFEKTVALAPDWGLAQGGLGLVLLGLRRLESATAALERAFALAPGEHTVGHVLGSLQMGREQLDAALRTYDETLRQTAGDCQVCRLNRSLALLKQGRYAQGWDEYEWRWPAKGQSPGLNGLTGPVWDGSSLAGKTLAVWAEQGLGDILQFVRFAWRVHAQGGSVHLLSRPSLDRLLATCPGVSRVASRIEDLASYDYQLPLASLPRVLSIQLPDLPAAPIPYLKPPEPRQRDPFGPRPKGVRRVGLVWAVEPDKPTWKERSCPLPLFRRLADIPGVELYSLQFGSRSGELREPGAPPAADLSAVLGDFASTAAFLEHLDLVITVDTSMAHLAGALGRPVWTLLHRKSDWRWLEDRDDTPWYPTMRLFRQQEHGAWEPVIERVAEALSRVPDGMEIPPPPAGRKI